MTTPAQPPTASQYETVIFERVGHVAHITLNRPEALNALNDQLSADLADAYHEFDADPDLWVAVLSGAGRAFCTGVDVRQVHLRPASEGTPRPSGSAEHEPLMNSVNWKPMIAAVHGFAFGAGLRTMMSSDLTVAAEGTQFQLVQVSRGIAGAPHWAQIWFAGGGRWANELALTGRRFTAEEALQHGIINRVVPQDQLLPVADDLAQQIAKNPPLSVRCNVRVMRHFSDKAQREALYYLMGLKLNQTEDFREASRAFVEKRAPVFHGR